MKAVSVNFLDGVKAPAKTVKSKVLFAWGKKVEEEREFFRLDHSILGGPDILWNGNQETIAFMDRYTYTDESDNLKSWSVSQKVSNRPWGLIQATANIELNNASGRYFPNGMDADTENLLETHELNAYNGYYIGNGKLVGAGEGEVYYTLCVDCEPGTKYRIFKAKQNANNVFRVGTSETALANGGELTQVMERDDYEEAIVETGTGERFLYIYYASSTENAHDALKTLVVEPVALTEANLPNRPVKLQVEIDGESVNLFTGYTARPEISIVNSTYGVTAYDAISYLSTRTSKLEAIVGKPLDKIIRALLLEAGFTEEQFKLEPGVQIKIDYVAPYDRNVANLLDELCAAEQYLLFSDGDGIIHGWNANHYEVAAGEEDWRVDFSNATEIDWESTSVLNDVKVKATPLKIVPASKFYSMGDPTDDHLVKRGETMTLWLDLTDENNNTIYAVDFETPEAKARNKSSFTANSQLDGAGTDLSDNIRISECANFGDSIKITFQNTGQADAYITSLALIGESAQRRELFGVEATDEDSIEDYGMNPDEGSGEVYQFESSFIQDEDYATGVATRLVALYAKPMNKIATSVFFAPQLEIGDQILARVGQFGSKNMLIFGQELSGNANADYKQKLYLEERPEVRFFRLDHSILGGPDVLAY